MEVLEQVLFATVGFIDANRFAVSLVLVGLIGFLAARELCRPTYRPLKRALLGFVGSVVWLTLFYDKLTALDWAVTTVTLLAISLFAYSWVRASVKEYLREIRLSDDLEETLMAMGYGKEVISDREPLRREFLQKIDSLRTGLIMGAVIIAATWAITHIMSFTYWTAALAALLFSGLICFFAMSVVEIRIPRSEKRIECYITGLSDAVARGLTVALLCAMVGLLIWLAVLVTTGVSLLFSPTVPTSAF